MILESNLYPTMHDTIERVMFDIQTARVQDSHGLNNDIRNVIFEIGQMHNDLVLFNLSGNYKEYAQCLRRIAAITVSKIQMGQHIGQTLTHGEVLPVFKNEDHG